MVQQRRLTKTEIAEQYRKRKNQDVKFFDHEELVCSYKTKTMTKAVFMTDILDRKTFKSFIEIKNTLNADKLVVYCNYAYYHSDTLEIILNRTE